MNGNRTQTSNYSSELCQSYAGAYSRQGNGTCMSVSAQQGEDSLRDPSQGHKLAWPSLTHWKTANKHPAFFLAAAAGREAHSSSSTASKRNPNLRSHSHCPLHLGLGGGPLWTLPLSGAVAEGMQGALSSPTLVQPYKPLHGTLAQPQLFPVKLGGSWNGLS